MGSGNYLPGGVLELSHSSFKLRAGQDGSALSTKEYGKLRIAERGQLSDNEDMTLRDVEKARERQQQALAKFHETIREAAREFSIREIAKVAGLTKSRIHQITKEKP
jgi:hypothetical protein